MKKVKRWLDNNSIDYTVNRGITIILEPNCVWVNGFGKEMLYDKEIFIFHDTTYHQYHMHEVTGYNMHKRLAWTGKQDEVIRVLNERLNGV